LDKEDDVYYSAHPAWNDNELNLFDNGIICVNNAKNAGGCILVAKAIAVFAKIASLPK